ncbi:MAG: hypothetical protein COY36_03400 [Zetaproteobacteria bacterium CG_4_10_14_0_2_um_filter_55_20]|nr:MAG: hypothetical protein COT53_10640 [Zetaproteobacteria bacterium CG08_land_8_20_14_0_20_55_17]PIY54313.1 MAG: hypothetical protein COZ01_00855 [Zetaproteobacteria bacterium CG_4_10_14_0_8_um_filter_55_43]PIZ39333.1 MAG: hypothetical protein COY36_03400 [Zetaproteobacteria bacterium CG_4_10_14_0_2_um_filter_55_20]
MKGEPLTSATHPEMMAWVDKHAGLEKLCERADGATLRIDVCSQRKRKKLRSHSRLNRAL